VTASLHVRYLRPTPMGPLLTIRAQAQKIEGRRVTVTCALYANGEECARGEVIAVLMPDDWLG
jgi:acyl-CoA thioesterase FadM